MPDTIRVCLIGAGRAARVHARSLVKYIPAAVAACLVDSSPEALNKTGDEFGIDKRFASLDDALAWGQFDAVVITTPTFTHHELAVSAAQAGKHVFLEKPMALTLEECDSIIEAAERGGVFLQLGFMRRFDPEFVAAYERIQHGEIGQPMMIKSLTHGPGLPPPWAHELKQSNGMLAEVNSHDWDCVRWLMGSDPQRIYVEVANFKGAARGVTAPDFYDNVLANIRFASGGLGSISGICPCDYGYDARVEIVGEKGILQIGDIRGQAVIVGTNRDQGYVTPIYRTWPQRFEWAYIREMEHFIESIQNGTAPKVNGVDGRWAVACVLAGTKSFQEERPVLIIEVNARVKV
jgi:predicted dehydrogenase